MKCMCGNDHEPKRIAGNVYVVCPECPPDSAYCLFSEEQHTLYWAVPYSVIDPALIDVSVLTGDRAGSRDNDEPAKTLQDVYDGRKFAEAVYLAMDWPTFPDLRCL